MFIRIEEIVNESKSTPHYRFSWWRDQDSDFFVKKPSFSREGVLEAFLLGHRLHRNCGYLSPSSGASNIRQVDEHELIFDTSYYNWHIVENTRLIDQDRYRSRNIFSWNNNELKIVENHHEIRISS